MSLFRIKTASRPILALGPPQQIRHVNISRAGQCTLQTTLKRGSEAYLSPLTTIQCSLSPPTLTPGRAYSSTMSDPTTLTISGPQSQEETVYIKRSYPKGKSEKLLTGLTHLLSSYHSSETSNTHRWTLSSSGDAIHRAVTITNPDSLNTLIEAIDRESQSLEHSPHYSHSGSQQSSSTVFVVTCTTHVPHGLSLKDVKLATKINEIVDRINVDVPGSVGNVDDLLVEPYGSLMRENEDRAKKAREDPESVCRVEEGS